MTAITFDTLRFSNRLKNAGVPPAQAEAEAEALAEVFEINLKELATKDDLRREIAESKAELIRWVVGVGLLQITLITALVLRLLPG